MNRRRLLGTVFVGVLSPRALAQATPRRLGLFGSEAQENLLDGMRGQFLAALAALGYVEGRNLEVHERYGRGDMQALPRLAAEMVALRPDAIVTEGTPATLALQAATRTIPIVTTVGDPVGAGFARDLRRPGGNITGVSQSRADLARKQVELLRQVFPNAREIAVLVNEQWTGVMSFVPPIEAAAGEASIAARVMRYTKDGFAARFKECADRGVRAAIAVADGGPRFGAAAVRNRVGVVIPIERLVAQDALAAIEADSVDLLHVHAAMVDRVLRGANPAETPFSTATRFRLIVNARTAAAIGVRLPQELLLRADRVIE